MFLTRWILVGLSLTVAFVPLVRAQEAVKNRTRAQIEKQILDVERERDRALQDRDMAVLDRIHRDDFVFVNTSGGLLTKGQYFDEIRMGTLKFLSFNQGDYHFQIYPNTVIVTGRTAGVVEYRGHVVDAPRRFTIVYVRDHDRWQLATYHGTLIAKQAVEGSSH